METKLTKFRRDELESCDSHSAPAALPRILFSFLLFSSLTTFLLFLFASFDASIASQRSFNSVSVRGVHH
jgi:hypothetical protein